MTIQIPVSKAESTYINLRSKGPAEDPYQKQYSYHYSKYAPEYIGKIWVCSEGYRYYGHETGENRRYHEYKKQKDKKYPKRRAEKIKLSGIIAFLGSLAFHNDILIYTAGGYKDLSKLSGIFYYACRNLQLHAKIR